MMIIAVLVSSDMTIHEPVDEQYFCWLYDLVANSHQKRADRTYWSLFRLFHETEFVWFVPNDDNRIGDGVMLRAEFLRERKMDHLDEDWMHLGCSFLEMLIGLAQRLSFLAEGKAREWFWILLVNVKLDGFDDKHFQSKVVQDIIESIIWRTYSADGSGGLFPLEHAKADQRHVELWYQLNAYLMEHE